MGNAVLRGLVLLETFLVSALEEHPSPICKCHALYGAWPEVHLPVMSSQLRLDPESRRPQGHHKDPLQSTRLYSRDDVNGSIYVQEAIVQQVQTGWQPHTPLGRGGQLPLQEPKVQLEIYKKDAAERMWKFFTFNTPPDQVLIPELSDDPSSSGESSASSSASSSSSKGAASGPSNKKQAKEITMPVTDGSGNGVLPQHHPRDHAMECNRPILAIRSHSHSLWPILSSKNGN